MSTSSSPQMHYRPKSLAWTPGGFKYQVKKDNTPIFTVWWGKKEKSKITIFYTEATVNRLVGALGEQSTNLCGT